ncbi:unnamed protein product [Linum trigynum]|uniref:Uncharacterized protein n=1 Tax=Linum trigynum TaxID=586398 RepID=A0AAV2E6A8_9ROSI
MEPAPRGRGARWIRTRVVARGRKKRPGSLTTVRSFAVDSNIGGVKDSTEPSMRPNAYLPKRRGILEIRHFPPNCGRRGEAEGGIDGGVGFSRRVAVDEAMFEEEEEEPEESVVDGFEEEEEGGDDGGRSWGGNEKTVRSDDEVRRSSNFGVQWH